MQNQRDVMYEILESLPQDGTPIRAKDLEKKAKMSSRSFYKAISYLEIIGAIEKKKVPSTRAVGIEYSISPDFGMIDLYKSSEDKCKNIDQVVYITNKLILELFNSYDGAEENQKEMIFDDRLSIIIRFLKLCKTLRDRSPKEE